ncbi:MAG: toll/interleukin-1 receptor domain-containing protein [Clostridium sp.]|uniref:toll/interleukin-1 receptor domain-containing protein n=1 Tax=Clostridium sp. TaxID=1506 RepID=UPI002902ABE1|nr:toll/interleukin-1 receptor domain-containing protein [Clostridium sp.]MDU1602827.1 toll/interleukin-1 receptor domain-containing protein [Clostridium sp.]
MKWDVFISHASDDKDGFVIPLVDKLKNYGVEVWFDKFALKIGDSLSRSIDKGLRESNYGVIVISKAFIRNNYTNYELTSLLNKEVGNRKIILPVWYDISEKDVKKYNYYLADKMALDSSNMTLDEIAESIIEVIRPDIYTIIDRLHVTKKLYNDSMIRNVKPDAIYNVMKNAMENKSKRYKRLPLDTMILLRIIHEVYKEVDSMSYEELVDIYKYNMNPQREALIEIKNATIYLENISGKNYDDKKKNCIYRIINMLSMYENIYYEDVPLNIISVEEFNRVKQSYKSFVPDTSKLDSTLLIIAKENEEKDNQEHDDKDEE